MKPARAESIDKEGVQRFAGRDAFISTVYDFSPRNLLIEQGRMRNTAVKIFLASLWCVCVYRAVTQSIVHDEAYTFALYLTRDTRWIFKDYDPNNHFLNTLLMKASVWLFGVEEWSLRVPALAGAGLYFAAVYRLCTMRVRCGGKTRLADKQSGV